MGEERKCAAHTEACHAVGVAFVPLVVELLGGLSEEAARTITDIGRHQGQRLGVTPSKTICHLFQRKEMLLCGSDASPLDRQLLMESNDYVFFCFRRGS